MRLERQPPRRQARGIPARPTSPPPPSQQAPPGDEETTPAEQPRQAEERTPADVPTPAADRTSADVPTPTPPPPAVSATASEPAPAPPAERRPLWRRALRVNLVLAGAAVVLLLVGYLAGVAVTRDGTSTPPQAAAPPSPTATSIVPAPPPRACVVAVEQADIAISYLVGNIRDQRLSRAIQEFVSSRRACQQAMR